MGGIWKQMKFQDYNRQSTERSILLPTPIALEMKINWIELIGIFKLWNENFSFTI